MHNNNNKIYQGNCKNLASLVDLGEIAHLKDASLY